MRIVQARGVQSFLTCIFCFGSTGPSDFGSPEKFWNFGNACSKCREPEPKGSAEWLEIHQTYIDCYYRQLHSPDCHCICSCKAFLGEKNQAAALENVLSDSGFIRSRSVHFKGLLPLYSFQGKLTKYVTDKRGLSFSVVDLMRSIYQSFLCFWSWRAPLWTMVVTLGNSVAFC